MANHSPYMVPPFVQLISWFCFCLRQQWALLKLRVGYVFLNIAISKQVYAVPYLVVCTRLHVLLREEPIQPYNCAGQFANSLTPRPMTVVFGFGMRLRVRMHTKVKKLTSQPTGSSSSVLRTAGKSWIGVTEKLGIRGNSCLGMNRFHATTIVNTYVSHSRDILIGERIRKMALLLLCLAVFRKAFGKVYWYCWS